MHRIEVDFEVWRELTSRRESEEVSYNDVLRKMLTLPPGAKPGAEETPAGEGLTMRGMLFPAGTKFRATCKGRRYSGEIIDGALVVNGERYQSPSRAGKALMGYNVNGWHFWQVKLPGSGEWRLLDSFRD